MRKFLTLFTMLCLSGMFALGQNKTVTGTVKDNSGSPLPFVSITVSGTKTGTTSDQNGNFTFQLKVAPH